MYQSYNRGPMLEMIHCETFVWQESKGKGTCDGVFRKKRFFTCEPNCGFFAAIHKVRRDQDVPYRGQYSDRSIPIHNDSPLYHQERKLIEESGLKEKDRIVWISDNGPEFGEVKWIGILPDSNRRDITVGVEFVSSLNLECIAE